MKRALEDIDWIGNWEEKNDAFEWDFTGIQKNWFIVCFCCYFRVLNALPDRCSIDLKIFGMQGVPRNFIDDRMKSKGRIWIVLRGNWIDCLIVDFVHF